MADQTLANYNPTPAQGWDHYGNPVGGAGHSPTEWGYDLYGNPSRHGAEWGSQLGVGDHGMINISNPGQLNYNDINPQAAEYIKQNDQLYQQMMKSRANPFNTEMYDQMKKKSDLNLSTSLGNQYASRGLAGSGSEVGAISNALNDNQMNWLMREQGDQQRYAQSLSGLNRQGYGQVLGLQNQYSNYENAFNQDVLGLYGMQQQSDAANNSMWSQLLSTGITAGATAFMGPAGGVAAQGLNSGIGGGGFNMGGDNTSGFQMPGGQFGQYGAQRSYGLEYGPNPGSDGW